jgi:hypothetical protein
MKNRVQTIYDHNSDKFIHLKREENIILNRVDINELNKRLNRNNKSNFYTTSLVAITSLSFLAALIIISIKF